MKTKFLLLLTLFYGGLYSQTMMSGDIQTHIESIISNLPDQGDNNYVEPSAMERTDWQTMLLNVVNANYSTAATEATALGYDLIEFSDNTNSETYYILETTNMGTNYWGTYVLNPNACRSEVVIMSPHPRKDFNTGKQGIYCFKELDAYFYMLSGTNRCNSNSFSTCSGSTKVCSLADPKVSEDYRITDMAHVVNSIWQKTTETIFDNVGGTYFVQLHGFTKLSDDPYVILSNGTDQTPMTDPMPTLETQLFAMDNSLTFETAHLDNWTRLVGFTNTNGRYINSSSDDCNSNATATSGRFLHIEQEKTKLRDDIIGWNKMAVALGETFNMGGCPSVVSLKVELLSFEALLFGDKIHLNWISENEFDHDYYSLEKSFDGNSFFEITRISGAANSNQQNEYFYKDEAHSGSNYYRLKMVDIFGKVTYSNIVLVNLQTDNFIKLYTTSEGIHINQPEPSKTEVLIYNELGQFFKRVELSETDYFQAINWSRSGIYFYQIKNSKTLQSGRFLIP